MLLFKLIDIIDILFQTRVKMYLVRSFNWPLLYSSTMTACRLNASIFALSRSGTARLARVPWPCLLWPGGCSCVRPDPPQFGTRHYNRRRRKWYWAWRCCLPSLLPSWLLLPPRTSNGCSSVEAPSSSLPMFMLSRQARSLPPNRASLGVRPIPLWDLVIFSYFDKFLKQEMVGRMDFAGRLNPY